MKYIIKTILASILVFSSILNASDDYSECITDIYFGNGVWNTYVQALKGRDELKIRLLEKGIIQENEIMKDGQTPLGKKYAFKIAYNWHGMYRNDSGHDEQFKMFFDVAETFVQMKEAGQVSSSSLFKFLEWFVVDRGYPEEFKQQVQVYIDLATTTHMSNVLEMVADYQQYSFDKGHRILLVSHSQGNLWANDMVKAFKPWQREYFRNVGVAVPADHLEAESRYVTLSCDKVMAIIPDHMPANKECYGVEEISGHEFMRSYLRNSNSEHEIFRNAEFYLKILGALDSQWITDQESDKNTCDYKITVKHRYDPSIEMGEKVYPFNASKKLYQVNGEYVKASCGGKNILETWDGKKDDECLMIDNEEKEKIVQVAKQSCGILTSNVNIESSCFVTRGWLNDVYQLLSYALGNYYKPFGFHGGVDLGAVPLENNWTDDTLLPRAMEAYSLLENKAIARIKEDVTLYKDCYGEVKIEISPPTCRKRVSGASGLNCTGSIKGTILYYKQ